MPAIDSNTKLLIQNNGFNAQSKAIAFSGASADALSLASSTDWDFGTTGDYTYETWIKWNTLALTVIGLGVARQLRF